MYLDVRVLWKGIEKGLVVLSRRLERLNLIMELLQGRDRRPGGVNRHVDLESLVLCPEEALFVLVLAHVLEVRVVLAAHRDAHPVVIQHSEVQWKTGRT